MPAFSIFARTNASIGVRTQVLFLTAGGIGFENG